MRDPTKIEMNLLRLIADHGPMNHDDERLSHYCDDNSTLTKPDTFNACHDLGWLVSSHDHDASISHVRITPEGKRLIGN